MESPMSCIRPSWPLAFLGDPHSQVEEYKLYLNKPPAGELSLHRRLPQDKAAALPLCTQAFEAVFDGVT